MKKMKLNLKSFQGDVKVLKDGTCIVSALQNEKFFVGDCGVVAKDHSTVLWDSKYIAFVKELFKKERELWIKENPSVITKHQFKDLSIDVEDGRLDIRFRYDDDCGNGHNSFAMTGDLYDRPDRIPHEANKMTHVGKRWLGSCGCLHDDILANTINGGGGFSSIVFKKAEMFHHTSSDSPMYYLENILYHAKAHPPIDGYLYFEDKALELRPQCMKAGTLVEMDKMAVTDPKRYSVKVDEKSFKILDIGGVRSCGMWPKLAIDDIDELFPVKLLNRYWGLMEEFKKMITEDLGMRW